jgi:hypothetical protein
MLNNPIFYFRSIYNVVVAFGTLFSDIHVRRTHPTDNTKNQTLKIPIRYGPREKWLTRLEQDPNAGIIGQEEQVQMTVPLMTYQITGFTFNGSRKLPTIGRHAHVVTSNSQVLSAQYNPVPYDIDIELVVMVKHLEDGLMIVEQIVPFFAPDYTLTLKDVPGMNIKKDVPVVLKGFSTEDNYEGPWDEKRVIQWTLSFTAQAYLYPPIKQVNVTTEAEVNMRIEEAIFRTDTTTPLPVATDATGVEDGGVDSNNNA